VERLRAVDGVDLGEVPEQFVQHPHHREDVEHLRGGRRGLAPVPPAEGHLRHLLAGAEAVVGSAAGEAART
jgi:hypothetical protein